VVCRREFEEPKHGVEKLVALVLGITGLKFNPGRHQIWHQPREGSQFRPDGKPNNVVGRPGRQHPTHQLYDRRVWQLTVNFEAGSARNLKSARFRKRDKFSREARLADACFPAEQNSFTSAIASSGKCMLERSEM
jgi:hypothetical protein